MRLFWSTQAEAGLSFLGPSGQPLTMNPSSTPAAEVAINSALVRSLLETQHPDLSGLLLEEVTAGFDNAVFRLGPKLAVRLPRRFAAVALLEHEQKWLPLIANQLPVPVPSTLRIGRPDRGYPWCWSILPWLKGEAADLASLKPDQAKPLARFLRALHVEAPAAMSEYGAVPRATWLRARGWATLFGLLLLDNGLADNPRHAKMGELTLRRIAEGPY
jgi:aminoglycoside phosphotransferase (APT) family kinase protein